MKGREIIENVAVFILLPPVVAVTWLLSCWKAPWMYERFNSLARG